MKREPLPKYIPTQLINFYIYIFFIKLIKRAMRDEKRNLPYDCLKNKLS